jgi:hypothetical protein
MAFLCLIRKPSSKYRACGADNLKDYLNMITTTLNRIRDHRPCSSGWRKLLAHLGKTEGDDEVLPYAVIVEACGMDDALWCCWAAAGAAAWAAAGDAAGAAAWAAFKADFLRVVGNIS